MDPCLAASLRTCLEDVSVPLSAHARRYTLTSMLFLVMTAVIGGADTWVEEFERWLCLPHGIPSHDTFGRVSALLDPEQLDEGFARWVQTLHGLLTGQVVDLDSKTTRRLHDRNHGWSALHTVSAGLCPVSISLLWVPGLTRDEGSLIMGWLPQLKRAPHRGLQSQPRSRRSRSRSGTGPVVRPWGPGPRPPGTGHPLGAT